MERRALELRTFGGLALHSCDFTRPKPLLLAAYLALEGPRPRPRLAELLWPGAADPMKSLTVALARLRKGAPGLVDADRRRAWTTATSDAARYLARLQEGDVGGALALYAGPFLDGLRPRDCSVELEEWVVETREFLAGCGRSALLDRAEAEAAEGRFRDAATIAARAHELAGTAPLEPEELERLLTLLRAADHPLAVEVRAEAKELGLEATWSATRARARLARGSRPQGASDGLPSRGTAFVGREREMARVWALLGRPSCRVLTLVGPAGVGKTRLAVRCAQREFVREGREGVHFVPLEAVASSRSIPASLADVLGLDPSGTTDPMARIVEHVGERRLLLLFDNLEHLADGSLLLASLLERCPNLQLLVTSRERLDLEEEHVLSLDGLPFPDDPALDRDEILGYDAVRLFVRRAQRARPEFAPDDDALRGVVRVCGLVGGLPLALELAAAWVRVLPCEEIAREIERDLDFLATDTRDVSPRHRSLRAAFEHSWRLLSAPEQEVLRRLSVFRGGFEREAAGAVAGADVRTLASLVDRSLLRSDRFGRYDRHPLLFEYTREKAAEEPRLLQEAREAHAAWFAGRLRDWHAELRAGDPRRALAAIEREVENLRTAWASPDAAGEASDAPDVARTLVEFFETRQAFGDGIAFFDAVLARTSADPGDRVARAHLRVARARLVLRLGSYREAADVASDAMDLVSLEAAPWVVLEGLRTVAAAHLHQGAYAEAERGYQEALRRAEEVGDGRAIGTSLGELGLVLARRGDGAGARRHLERALRLARERRDRLQVVRQLNSLGLLHDLAGDLVEAHDHWQEALRLSREVDDRRMTLKLLVNLGLVAHKLGDHERAGSRYREAWREAQRAGDRMLQSVVRSKQGWLLTSLRRPDEAEPYFAQALEIAREIGEAPRILEYIGGLAEVRVMQGRTVGAVRLLSFLKHHELAGEHVRREADRWLAHLRPRLAPAAMHAALEAGRHARTEGVVREVLGEAEAGR